MRFSLLSLTPILLCVSACGESVAVTPVFDMGERTIVLTGQTLSTTSPQPDVTATEETPPLPPAAPPEAFAAEELELFGRHCGACHGERGRGDGALAKSFDPPPRDFGSGHFKVRSNRRGLPTDDDLRRVITHGMPGSAMPGSPYLSDDEQAALVRVVRRLAFVAKVSDLLADAAADDDDELTPPEAQQIAADLHATRDVFEVPERNDIPLEATPARVFEFYCGECHGNDGTAIGAADDELEDVDGRPTRARNLTREPLKGGDRPDDIIRRAYLGMPGTPMPESTARPENLWAIADHMRVLRADIPEFPESTARVESTADGAEPSASALPLFPARPDGMDTYAADVSVMRADGRLDVRIAWAAADGSTSAEASLRVAGETPQSFAWADLLELGAATPAVNEDGLFIVTITVDDPPGAGLWLSITTREHAGDSNATRDSLSAWHPVDDAR